MTKTFTYTSPNPLLYPSPPHRGTTHRIEYTPGPDGVASFLTTLNELGIRVASASQVTFLCRCPDTGEDLALKGLAAFDAAAYCASITAAKRMLRGGGRRRAVSSAGSDDSSGSGVGGPAGSDLGVHASHPESPTAAGAAAGALLRCHEPHHNHHHADAAAAVPGRGGGRRAAAAAAAAEPEAGLLRSTFAVAAGGAAASPAAQPAPADASTRWRRRRGLRRSSSDPSLAALDADGNEGGASDAAGAHGGSSGFWHAASSLATMLFRAPVTL